MATTQANEQSTSKKALPNRACPEHGDYTISTPDGGKHWQRQCTQGDEAHAEQTTHPLPVTTAARFLLGLPWAQYLKVQKGDGSNATARKVALAALAKK